MKSLYLILVGIFVAEISQAQIGIRYDNSESSSYSSAMKSDDFTYLIWDRNHGGEGHFSSSTKPMFMYWDYDDNKLGYLIDTQNMTELNASFSSLSVANDFSLFGYIEVKNTDAYHLLNLVGDGQDVKHYSYNDVGPGNRPDYFFHRARGTETVPSNVIDQDQLGTITWRGYNDGFVDGAAIIASVDGTPTTGNMPTKIEFKMADDSGTKTTRMIMNSDGNIGIGTTIPDAKLTVKGDIHAEKVTVDLNIPAPDYVFEEDYDLRSLEETATYIEENKHLPEVPSARELKASGIDLVEMNMLLLKKIEELTLHMIHLKKENEIQQQRIQKLETR